MSKKVLAVVPLLFATLCDAQIRPSMFGLGAGDPLYGTRRAGRKRLGEQGKPIEQALVWLARTQREDGLWSAGVEADPDADTVVTSLALIALMADGSSMRSGPFKNNVKRAVVALRKLRRSDGAFSKTEGVPPAVLRASAYATAAITEAHMFSKYKILKRDAGLGAAFLAKHAARLDAEMQLWRAIARRHAAFVGPIATPQRARTPIDLATQLFLEHTPRKTVVAKLSVSHKDWSCLDAYCTGTVLHHTATSRWKLWHASFAKAAQKRQAQGGEDKGSFPPRGDTGLRRSRVYSTALQTMTLLSGSQFHDPMLGRAFMDRLEAALTAKDNKLLAEVIDHEAAVRIGFRRPRLTPGLQNFAADLAKGNLRTEGPLGALRAAFQDGGRVQFLGTRTKGFTPTVLVRIVAKEGLWMEYLEFFIKRDKAGRPVAEDLWTSSMGERISGIALRIWSMGMGGSLLERLFGTRADKKRIRDYITAAGEPQEVLRLYLALPHPQQQNPLILIHRARAARSLAEAGDKLAAAALRETVERLSRHSPASDSTVGLKLFKLTTEEASGNLEQALSELRWLQQVAADPMLLLRQAGLLTALKRAEEAKPLVNAAERVQPGLAARYREFLASPEYRRLRGF